MLNTRFNHGIKFYRRDIIERDVIPARISIDGWEYAKNNTRVCAHYTCTKLVLIYNFPLITQSLLIVLKMIFAQKKHKLLDTYCFLVGNLTLTNLNWSFTSIKLWDFKNSLFVYLYRYNVFSSTCWKWTNYYIFYQW